MEPGSSEWLAQVDEDIVDPGQPIIDPHHHLWPEGQGIPYTLEDLHGDTGAGHNVVATVFMECHAAYRTDGPDHLRCVGETEFVTENARASEAAEGQAPIRGIVGGADLRLANLDEVLDAHVAVAGDLFKGIRHALASDPEPESLTIAGRAEPNLASDPAFQAGVRRLGERGLTYDSWHYHHQNHEFAALADAAPDTTMILDHFGTPLGVGRFAGRHDEIFPDWAKDVAAIAERPNVRAKLGGMAMPDNGFGWHEQDRPATSDEFVAAQERWYLHMIECFGPDRCMFESNFPVDRFSISYPVLWNGIKKIAARFTPDERTLMFETTAATTYQL